MIKDSIKDIIIYTMPVLITQSIGLLLIPLYTRVLTTSDYGAYDLFMLLSNLINITITLQLSQGIGRIYNELKNEKEIQIYTSTLILFAILINIMFLIVSNSFVESISVLLFGDIKYSYLLNIGILYISLNSIFYVTSNQLRWCLKSKQYTFLQSLNVILVGSLSFIFAYILDFGLLGIIYSLLISISTVLLICIYLIKDQLIFKFDFKKLFSLLNYSLPLLASVIVYFLATYIDRLFINYYLGLDSLGIYSVSYRYASVAIIVFAGFQNALEPLMFKHYKDPNTPIQISKLFRYFFVVATLVFMILFLFVDEAFKIFTTQPFYDAKNYIVFLIPAIILSNSYVFSIGLKISNKTNYILVVNLIGVISNILLNFLLIEQFEIYGVAVATLISFIIVFTLNMVFSNKFYKIKFYFKKYLFFILFITSILYFVYYLFNNLDLFIYIKFLLFFITALFLYLFNFINKQEITFIYNYFKRVKNGI